jgi:glycosyltransferase 2 family protein
MSRRVRWLTHLLGPAVLAYFLATSDLHRIASILREVRWTPLVLSLVLFPGVVVTKAWRWQRLIDELGMPVPSFGRASTLFLIGQFAGAATPGQSGDFVRAWYLREQGGALSTALFSILFDRLLDFLLLALLAVAGLAAFLDVFPRPMRPAILVSTVGFAVAVVVVVPALMGRRSRRALFERLRRLAPVSFAARLERWQALLDSLEIHPPLVLALLGATVAATAVVMVRIWLLFRALDVIVPSALLVAAAALISILQTLPVSIAGVGVRDAVLVAALTRYGYPAERALALSALFLVLVIEQMLIGFLVTMRHPLGAAAAQGVMSAATPDDAGPPRP